MFNDRGRGVSSSKEDFIYSSFHASDMTAKCDVFFKTSLVFKEGPGIHRLSAPPSGLGKKLVILHWGTNSPLNESLGEKSNFRERKLELSGKKITLIVTQKNKHSRIGATTYLQRELSICTTMF